MALNPATDNQRTRGDRNVTRRLVLNSIHYRFSAEFVAVDKDSFINAFREMPHYNMALSSDYQHRSGQHPPNAWPAAPDKSHFAGHMRRVRCVWGQRDICQRDSWGDNRKFRWFISLQEHSTPFLLVLLLVTPLISVDISLPIYPSVQAVTSIKPRILFIGHSSLALYKQLVLQNHRQGFAEKPK